MSTVIRFRFLAGRYHSTPWGAHVNEAALEWPPSPWRVLRALIAVWHRKVDPDEVPEEALARLIPRLSETAPEYRLPKAIHAHTRHYMPTRSGRSEKPTLVFDAFARIPREEDLVMVWPDLELEEPERAHLSLLLTRLGYLGRAESWVEADLLDADWEGEVNCRPLDESDSTAQGSDGYQTVSLPAPLEPAQYRDWRAYEVEARDLDRSRVGVRDKRLLATLPEALVDALRLDTSDVRAQGWSRHPGMRFVPYSRPADSLRSAQAPRAPEADDPSVTTVRLILRGKPVINRGMPLPQVEDAIRIGEAVRAAAMKHAEWLAEDGAGEDAIPAALSGHGMGTDNVHEHAFYLPEDHDRDGRIDHILIYADSGLDRRAVAALAAIEKIWIDSDHEWNVSFDAAGHSETTAGENEPGEVLWDHPYLRSSTSWVSETPYLHPWYRKKKFGVEDQIRRECRERGLPEPQLERLESRRLRGRDRRPVHFHRFRTRGRRRASQPDTRGSLWRLSFPEPVSGPLALGFGCHFGLGIFRPGCTD